MNKPYKTQPRFEYKMVVKGYDLDWVRSFILAHPKAFFMRYPCRWINNIYFDSECLLSYRQNLSGNSIREKNRFRWYGDSKHNVKGHLELKCKKNGLGWKLIQDIDGVLDFTTLSWNETVEKIKDELSDFMRIRFNEKDMPIIINRYQREYYEAKDKSCRITLDSSQTVYNQRLCNKPNFEFVIPSANNIIIELKFIPGKKRSY